MIHTQQTKWLAIAVGILMGFLWHYLNGEMFGNLAIARSPEQWGTVARVGIPVFLFFVLAAVTCWALAKCFGSASAAAVWASFASYALGEIYALVAVSHGAPEILMSLLLVCAGALAAYIGHRVARQKI